MKHEGQCTIVVKDTNSAVRQTRLVEFKTQFWCLIGQGNFGKLFYVSEHPFNGDSCSVYLKERIK